MCTFLCVAPLPLHRNHQDIHVSNRTRIAQEAIDKFSVLHEAASTIKKTCDQEFSPTWCVGVELIYLLRLCWVSSSFPVYFEVSLAHPGPQPRRTHFSYSRSCWHLFQRYMYLSHSPQALHCRQKTLARLSPPNPSTLRIFTCTKRSVWCTLSCPIRSSLRARPPFSCVFLCRRING